MAEPIDRERPPSPEGVGEATAMLRRAALGDKGGRDGLFALLFGELRVLAGRVMAHEHEGHTLQPTALLNEVWLKLFADDTGAFADRTHFLAIAARAMRQVLVDHARTRKRIKRGGAWQRVDLAALAGVDGEEGKLDLVDLDAALEELRAIAPRPAEVVELRFFGGLEVEEVAAALATSESTIAREWRFARAWLLKRLGER